MSVISILPAPTSPSLSKNRVVISPLLGFGNTLASGELSIFSRTGQVVYQGDLAGAWDGRSAAGQYCPEGAYLYMIKVVTHQGSQEIHSGLMVLLR